MTNISLSLPAQKSSIRAIRFIPELNIAALNQHKDKELKFWYLLRACDVDGRGRVLLNDALNILLGDFGYTKTTFYRTVGKIFRRHFGQSAGRTRHRPSLNLRANYFNSY